MNGSLRITATKGKPMRHTLTLFTQVYAQAREIITPVYAVLSVCALLAMSAQLTQLHAQEAEVMQETQSEAPQKTKKPKAEKENKDKNQAEKKSSTPKEDKQFPIKTAWIVSSFQGKTFGVDRPTFVLDDNYRAKGFGGCNTYSATAYPLRGQGFAVGPIALTKKTCDKNTSDLEKAFLLALRSSEKWDLVEGSLVLSGARGAIKLERSF